MAGIGKAASVMAVIQISQQVLSLCWKYYSEAKSAKKDMESLCNQLTAPRGIPEKVQELLQGPKANESPASSLLVGRIAQCSSEPHGLRDKYEATFSPALATDQISLIADTDGGLTQLTQDFAAARVDTTAGTESPKQDLSVAGQDRYLAKLPCADGAASNSYLRRHEPQRLTRTRVDLLGQLVGWNHDLHGECIFWLSGMAGTGKSTIARTAARAFDEEKLLHGCEFS
ncbi:hypothetical protein FGG08_006367 [Glutinoglossum americanum]|uniref:Uncharacterized protein n=1 Tax=Glutinoglossum americanum TaxID=1670608 RepID=A0A9P8I125_9PEZI|nr:hypothetical protein FGG08_006367 [Glutinoglossum americanum]